MSLKSFLKKPINSLLLKATGFLFLPLLGFVLFFWLAYPLKPHCSLGQGLLGCTPRCEPVSFFEDGSPAGYKETPCFHEEPSPFQLAIFNYRLLIPLILFVGVSFWIYKDGFKKVIGKLAYIAFAPFFIFKENRENRNIVSRLLVIIIIFFLVIEWALGYSVVFATFTGKDLFTSSPPQSQTQVAPLSPSFTGQEVFDAVNEYRKENGVSELKLDEVLCNNIAQRYLDIEAGEKENIAHKGFDEWYKKYAEPYGYAASENYACGQNPEDIIKAWDGSPSHKLSILNEKNKLACAYASSGCAVLILGYKSSQVKGVNTYNQARISTPTPDPDPVVDCLISSECGGGSRQMRFSECNQMICCTIHEKCGGGARFITKTECNNLYCCFLGDGTSKLMTKNECDNYYNNNRQDNKPVYINPPTSPMSNKVPVFLTYSKLTTYCPPQNVDAVKSIDATMNSKVSEWAKNYNDCVSNFRETDSCYVSCKSTYTNGMNTCTSTYGYSGDNYDACTKEVLDNYSACISKCPSTAEACSWVYAEQKRLSSQITDLCK